MSEETETVPARDRGPVRHALLRIANVNPKSVLTNSDEVLYCAIGCFMCLYVPYAVFGGAEFIKASQGGRSVWWEWLVGLVVAFAVITFDRAVVGRITTNYTNLDSDKEGNLLTKPSVWVYVARGAFAVLMAVVITEPIMLARYESDIQERLAQVANATITKVTDAGAVPALTKQLGTLQVADTTASSAVNALRSQAATDNTQGSQLHQQALQDSQGQGIGRLVGCPAGGECWALEHESQLAYSAAMSVNNQATSLQQTQQPAAKARATEEQAIEREIKAAQTSGVTAASENKGFGAQSAAMWYLVVHDFWGIGVFYIGTALLLLALDCAAILLKFTSFNNGYERTEARAARASERLLAMASARSTQNYKAGLEIIEAATAIVPTVVAEEVASFSNDEISSEVRARLHAEVTRLVGGQSQNTREHVTGRSRRQGAESARHRRVLTRSSLAVAVIGGATALGFGLLGGHGTNGHSGVLSIDQRAASAYAVSPTSVIARFRADSAPILGVSTGESTGHAEHTCQQVESALNKISQPALLSADASISNPKLSDLAFDERTARMDAVNECLLRNQKPFDADLKTAQLAAKYFDQQEDGR